MSKIEVTLKDDKLVIEKKNSRIDEKNIEKIPLDLIEYGKSYKSNINASNAKEKNKVFFMETIERDKSISQKNEEMDDESDNEKDGEDVKENDVIIVYSKDGIIRYAYCTQSDAYRKIIRLRYRILKVSLTKKVLKIKVLAYVINNCKRNIKETTFYIDEVLGQKCTLKEYTKQISKLQILEDRNIYTFKFKIDDIIADKSVINGPIRFALNIDAPMKSVFTKDYAIHIRRTIKGNLALVQRLKEPIENTFKFKIMESRPVSSFLYFVSKILIKIRKNSINLLYEKFASKAEEGTYDLFLLMQKNNKGKNYFIITEDSPDYEKIKDNKNVVKRYSLKYYWLLYNANNFISTEAPIHLNILRSNNKALRKSIIDKPFIFLQHGVTYLKAQANNSTFAKGKEGEVSYIVVGSEKEKDIVVDMLGIDEEQVLKTGLPIFSKIKYNHINENSDDIVTIMLTWKPYEEQLYNFEESTYYNNVLKIYNMLTKYIDKNKILIIGHPKANELLNNTDLKDALYQGQISKALEMTKLLITDYSSVCYNAFYQGAGVVFYQEDIEKYEAENGKLIPNDDEYIGKRAFNINELESIIMEIIENNKIKLSEVRRKEFENNYKTINEFTDGKNIDRIYEKLIKLRLI